MALLEPHPKIWAAIEQTRMIRLQYHDKDCILEPHDHGILNRSVQLLSRQVGGSSSRPLPNRVLMKVVEMSDIQLLDETFPGGRPTGSGKHLKWDKLFIRVKPADEAASSNGAD
jgi:hypothetical protein